MNTREKSRRGNLQIQPLTSSSCRHGAFVFASFNVSVCHKQLTVKRGLISAETLHHWSAALTFLFGLPNGRLANCVALRRRSSSQEHILHRWWKDTLTFVRIVSLGLWEVDINVSQVQSESWQPRSQRTTQHTPHSSTSKQAAISLHTDRALKHIYTCRHTILQNTIQNTHLPVYFTKLCIYRFLLNSYL